MSLPDKYRYIVIEGPIGAGKTSLARALAAACGGSLVLEDPDGNPFLPRFYQDASVMRCRRSSFSSFSA